LEAEVQLTSNYSNYYSKKVSIHTASRIQLWLGFVGLELGFRAIRVRIRVRLGFMVRVSRVKV